MMKAAIIFTLLLTTVLCRPARKPVSSSESSEEQVKPARGSRVLALPQETAAVQKVQISEDSSVTSEEAVVDMVSAVKSAITDILSESASLPDPSATPDTASDQSQDDDDADDDDNSEDTDEDESDESSESTLSPVTVTTAMVVETVEPTADATLEPITPTVVVDQGRGDSLGRYPSDYKSTLYMEDKSYQKVPSPYKSYEILDGGKKMAYDLTDGNDVQKGLKVYKALQVHNDLLEEDTSTPEVESQGLDTSSPDQEASPKQALLPSEQEVSFSPSDAAPTESSSATEEEEEELEEEESTASPSDSASASQESDDSEDATATPGAADSQSDESDSAEGDSDEEGAAVVPDAATAAPASVSAK